MPTYEEILSLAKRLSQSDQVRLLGELAALVQPVEVEGTDEIMALQNRGMICPHPQPFSPGRRELEVLFPLPLGEG